MYLPIHLRNLETTTKILSRHSWDLYEISEIWMGDWQSQSLMKSYLMTSGLVILRRSISLFGKQDKYYLFITFISFSWKYSNIFHNAIDIKVVIIL